MIELGARDVRSLRLWATLVDDDSGKGSADPDGSPVEEAKFGDFEIFVPRRDAYSRLMGISKLRELVWVFSDSWGCMGVSVGWFDDRPLGGRELVPFHCLLSSSDAGAFDLIVSVVHTDPAEAELRIPDAECNVGSDGSELDDRQGSKIVGFWLDVVPADASDCRILK